MALTISGGGANFIAGQVVYPASVKGIWTTIHNSLIATESTAANLAKPYNLSDTNAVWVAVPDNCTRCVIRGKCAVALSAVTTSPVIYVYGMYTNSIGGSALTTGSSVPADASFKRIDVTDPAAVTSTGLTLTFAAASSNANIQDATYLYSNETTAIDLKGAAYVSILVKTAGAGLTNGGTPTAEIMFLN